MRSYSFVRSFEDLRMKDIPSTGGKNASLGEMIHALTNEGIDVPHGFAITAEAYFAFLTHNRIKEKMADILKQKSSLQTKGTAIRGLILRGKIFTELQEAIVSAYDALCKEYGGEISVAVRSSATAEDLPEASFAGQQESYLNIVGTKTLLKAYVKCLASLFTDRAISYREKKGFDHLKIALSVGVQKMARSDKGGSGVMFTLDTETGFRKVVIINAAYGLGENVVKGQISPDEYMVFKPILDKKGLDPIIEKKIGKKEKKLICIGKKATLNITTTKKEQSSCVLSDDEILKLAKWGCIIEKHYGKPMDIEWAKDGIDGKIYIVQARPETVQSQKEPDVFKSYALKEKGKRILEGLAIGEAITKGKVQIIRSSKEIENFKNGNILVTSMTAPDWVPLMMKASGIITDHGGRTSHAAIVSRELGIPAVVGTNTATKSLKNGDEITLSCAEGDIGYIYEGDLEFEEEKIDLEKLPKIKTDIMLNLANPDSAFRWWHLPAKGIGLARMEFVITNIIKIHPMALVRYRQLKDKKAKKIIAEMTKNYADKSAYFIDLLAISIAKVAASQYPYPVIVRMSDFKTNEYANLIGGKEFEPHEENPMLGFRGASRYYNARYREGFALECAAIKKVRETIGLTNVKAMIPFCRTLGEADKVIHEMAKNGLKRGVNDLEVYVMCEIPSNVILAKDFAKRFDGFSIGSNDLTQLILGIDRDSEELSSLFDERNEAVKAMIREVIKVAHKEKCKVGICGQAPSDYPDFAVFLVEEGIDSISLNPDSVINIIKRLAKH